MVEKLKFKSKHDEWQYEQWTKDEVYQAYLSEYKTRMMLSKECNRLNRKLAEIRYAASTHND